MTSPADKIYNATYFDGQSSKGKEAHILFQPDEILIQLHPATDHSEGIRWDVNSIHPDEIDDPKFVVLKYGSFPYQILQIQGQNFFEELLAAYPNAGFHKPTYHFVLGIGWKKLTVGIGVIAAIFLNVYFFGIPWAAERIAEKVPLDVEQKLGNEAFTHLKKSVDIDEKRTLAANKFFEQLKIKDRKPIEIIVVNDTASEVVNAFAMPGGKIVIYGGILRSIQSYDELAALLSHEYAHVEKRHTMRTIMRNTSDYILITLLFSDLNAVSAVLLNNLHNLHSLSYSRALEKEADFRGLEILNDTHVDTDGMIRLFERLKEQGGDKIPEVVSSHPLLENRQEYIKAESKRNKTFIGQNDSLQHYWQELRFEPVK